MIQFNLLPDVKLDYIKTKKMQQLVVTVAGITAIACLSILILLFMVVNVLQKKHLNDVNKDIKNSIKELKANTDLPKILTIQNQLKNLEDLHNKKPVTSRLYGYLKQIVPTKISVSSLNVDFDLHTMQLTGNAESLQDLNVFVDTLKFTSYTTGKYLGEWENGKGYLPTDTVSHHGITYVASADHVADISNEPGSGANWKSNWTEAPKAFSSVVLQSFGLSDKGTSYSISLIYDPSLFTSTNTTNLVIPNTVTTRSVIDKPLFTNQTNPSTNTTGQ